MSPAEVVTLAVASGLAFVLGVLAGIGLVYRVRQLEVRDRFSRDVELIVERQRREGR